MDTKGLLGNKRGHHEEISTGSINITIEEKTVTRITDRDGR